MKDYKNTYCNPIPLPDYPLGYSKGRYTGGNFRETADPSVLYYGGKWYLYSSCGMMYSTDDFVHWKHHRLEPYDIGYAPTIVYHKGRFYLTASGSDIYVSDSPEGPFTSLGPMKNPDGTVFGHSDPMMFSDDDGRLYFYWGCGNNICGVELDSDDPTQMITEPADMFEYNYHHEWERIGDYNQNGFRSWIEGSWMVKLGGTYYLTYAAPGTQWATYGMGAYKSKSPLGPFEYMVSSPFISKKHGLVRGPGHGSVVRGPEDTLWAFYTCKVCYDRDFERRIGFDALGVDENGDLFVKNVTETPQWAPGTVKHPEITNDAGLLPLTFSVFCYASSYAPGRTPNYAFDDSMLSWWQPDDGDTAPSLTADFEDNCLTVCAVRLMWRDIGIDRDKGILPGPYRYTVEYRGRDGEWRMLIDKSENDTDMVIDYIPVDSVTAKALRLNILGAPDGIKPGVISFTAFGGWPPSDGVDPLNSGEEPDETVPKFI